MRRKRQPTYGVAEQARLGPSVQGATVFALGANRERLAEGQEPKPQEMTPIPPGSDDHRIIRMRIVFATRVNR
jgi:hypothetical protein